MSPTEAIPEWAVNSIGFLSITRTNEELSLVCSEAVIPDGCLVEGDWSLLKVNGPVPFDQTGVLESFAAPLANAKISIFAVSTFDTDYILVKSWSLGSACEALCSAGHELVSLSP